MMNIQTRHDVTPQLTPINSILYQTDTDTVYGNVGIGDIVRIKDAGKTYDTYMGAFNHFSIFDGNTPNYKPNPFDGQYRQLRLPIAKKNYPRCIPRIFKVIGLAIHECGDCVVIACIEDHKKQKLVIGVDGLDVLSQNPKNIDKPIRVRRIKRTYNT